MLILQKNDHILRTSAETINPIDHPTTIRLKEKKLNKAPIQINEN